LKEGFFLLLLQVSLSSFVPTGSSRNLFSLSRVFFLFSGLIKSLTILETTDGPANVPLSKSLAGSAPISSSPPAGAASGERGNARLPSVAAPESSFTSTGTSALILSSSLGGATFSPPPVMLLGLLVLLLHHRQHQ
jgi:hypothetical protein